MKFKKDYVFLPLLVVSLLGTSVGYFKVTEMFNEPF